MSESVRTTRSPYLSSVSHAADVLYLFAERNGQTLGVTEVADALGFSKAMAYRLMATLRNARLLGYDDVTRRYTLGPGVLRLGFSYQAGADLRTQAGPSLEKLARDFGVTSTLSARTGWSRVYLDQRLPDTEFKILVELGRSFPLHTGASSKAILAALRDDELEEYLSHPLTALTPRTIVDPAELQQEIAAIRKEGIASSSGERQAGATAMAAALVDANGTVKGSISVTASWPQIDGQRTLISLALIEESRAISLRL